MGLLDTFLAPLHELHSMVSGLASLADVELSGIEPRSEKKGNSKMASTPYDPQYFSGPGFGGTVTTTTTSLNQYYTIDVQQAMLQQQTYLAQLNAVRESERMQAPMTAFLDSLFKKPAPPPLAKTLPFTTKPEVPF